ncbi:MAG: phage/plasmid primase, P4 family [Methylococcaceae bacterium]
MIFLPDDVDYSTMPDYGEDINNENLQLAKQIFAIPTLPTSNARDGTHNTRALSELGNAERLNDTHNGNLHYVSDCKAWLYWRKDAWLWDTDGAVIRSLAAKLPQQIYSEGAGHLANSEYFAKWSRTSQTERTVLASVSMLSDFETVRLPLALVDADAFKVGFDQAQQVIDLKTGAARPALQSDLITKSLNVSVLGDATKALRWQAFLSQVFDDDVELIDWLKRWCGYMLTGSTSDQIFIFCFGLGANGKSVFGDILRYILLDYARAIASETLTDSKRDAGSASPDLAELVGARLAICGETEDGQALAESLVKGLVSGDTMTVRKLRCDPFQFTPQFKLMVLGNHKPIIKGNDYGIWRRVRLIPFRRIFKPEERDAGLAEKLKAEAPHILAWMVDGCLDWQKRGLSDTPKTILEATCGYQEEQDLIGGWLNECCEMSPHNEMSSTELYTSYKDWCIANGLRPSSNVALGRRLSERGLNCRQSSGKRLWSGIAIIFNGQTDYAANF